MKRRIAIAPASADISSTGWTRVATDPDCHWNIWGTDAADARVPHGTREVQRHELLPVSDEELDALRESPAFAGVEPTADDVRSLRGDPSHSWYLWVAPLCQLEAGEAGRVYADAVLSVDSTLTDICIRHLSGSWYSFIGLGGRMIAVVDPATNSASFSSEEDAEAAALAIIFERRDEWQARLRRILVGWAPEAVEAIIAGDVPVVFGCWAYGPVRVRVIEGEGGDFWAVRPRESRGWPAMGANTTEDRILYRGRFYTRPQLRRRLKYLEMKAASAKTAAARQRYSRAAADLEKRLFS